MQLDWMSGIIILVAVYGIFGLGILPVLLFFLIKFINDGIRKRKRVFWKVSIVLALLTLTWPLYLPAYSILITNILKHF